MSKRNTLTHTYTYALCPTVHLRQGMHYPPVLYRCPSPLGIYMLPACLPACLTHSVPHRPRHTLSCTHTNSPGFVPCLGALCQAKSSSMGCRRWRRWKRRRCKSTCCSQNPEVRVEITPPCTAVCTTIRLARRARICHICVAGYITD